MSDPCVIVKVAVEGNLDEIVVRRLVTYAGAQPGDVYGLEGKDRLQQLIKGYNEAANYHPWIAVVDLDNSHDCAPLLREEWLSQTAPFMCFRIAVRSIETWLLADRERIATFLGISQALVPAEPEALSNPKQEMVSLARRSRRSAIYKDMVPRDGSGISIGPAYSSQLIDFTNNHWRPGDAATRSPSLKKAINCIEGLIGIWQKQLFPRNS